MWTCASSTIAGCTKSKHDDLNPNLECSDDDASIDTNREEGLECPICWESFNLVENVPYVLWCGHTLCKHCVLGLPWAALKFPTLPIQLPFVITCPWCNLLSPRMIYKGAIRFPRKNYFILWMVESMNGDRTRSYASANGEVRQPGSFSGNTGVNTQSHLRNRRDIPHSPEGTTEPHHNMSLVGQYFNRERFNMSLRKSLAFVVHLTAKFPLVVVFLLVTLYAIPASAAILALYLLITILFAFPSFLVLYFAYPCLDWLVREILT
ncbi:uncharacterized protein LOC130800417 [Amaranthus tricolor]|uniref:uncharacterized protein LOC130800417 n=1 Tax=Amaranthus tricolor TaxID=29722 RepID=UPI002589E719|nr:uncharacterized protein LOC130800417 [Amaranthus tricolor]